MVADRPEKVAVVMVGADLVVVETVVEVQAEAEMDVAGKVLEKEDILELEGLVVMVDLPMVISEVLEGMMEDFQAADVRVVDMTDTEAVEMVSDLWEEEVEVGEGPDRVVEVLMAVMAVEDPLEVEVMG